VEERYWCLDKLNLGSVGGVMLMDRSFQDLLKVHRWFCKEKIRTLKNMLFEQNGYYSIMYNPRTRCSTGISQYPGFWWIR